MGTQASSDLVATPWSESAGHCDCCAKATRTIWGNVSSGNEILAVYFIQWTVDSLDHFPNIDLILGPWGDETFPHQRSLVCLLARPKSLGGSVMIIDGDARFAGKKEVCGQALKREEIIDSPLAAVVFEIVDAILIHDPRVSDAIAR